MSLLLFGIGIDLVVETRLEPGFGKDLFCSRI